MRKKVLLIIPATIAVIAVGLIVVANYLVRNLVDERMTDSSLQVITRHWNTVHLVSNGTAI